MSKTHITAMIVSTALAVLVLAGCASGVAGTAQVGSATKCTVVTDLCTAQDVTDGAYYFDDGAVIPSTVVVTPTATATVHPPTTVTQAPSTVTQAPRTVTAASTVTQQQTVNPGNGNGSSLGNHPSAVVNGPDSANYQIANDSSIAESTIGYWIPQLSANTDSPSAMTAFFSLQDSGYSDVFMVSSNDYSSFRYPNYFVTMIPREFSSAAEANAWCDSNGFASGNCFAKRLSHTDGWEGNNVDR